MLSKIYLNAVDIVLYYNKYVGTKMDKVKIKQNRDTPILDTSVDSEYTYKFQCYASLYNYAHHDDNGCSIWPVTN